ncbi:MAG: MarR family transcriptional regulator [Clostridia bacterium]|jgi:DNA-binding MarR family transcriptional regulator|nr:MarR family transcriptional regulator [Clostridia bacterium]
MKYEQLLLKNQLCFPFYAASKEVIKRYKPYLDEVGITYTQYITMMVLWEKNNITVKEIGEHLYLDSGTMTPLIKKLEKNDLIIRERDKSDERKVIVSLTKKGLELQEKVKHIPSEIGKCINLSGDEMKTLYKLVYKVLEDVRD